MELYFRVHGVDLQKVAQELLKMKNSEVHVGLFANKVSKDVLTAAWVNEFGATIKKTPKMQAFLGAMARKFGIKLDPAKAKKKGFVVIPARSFFRRGVDEHKSELVEILGRMYQYVLTGQATARDALSAAGLKCEQVIKLTINKVNEPPLHPLTVAMKRGDKPLVHTGTMRNAITFRIEGPAASG